MATYAIIGVVYIIACVLIFKIYKIKRPHAAFVAFFAVSILTIHFEPTMINLGLFEHDSAKLLGVHLLGVIPIEDMLYVLFAAIVVPSLWDRFKAAEQT